MLFSPTSGMTWLRPCRLLSSRRGWIGVDIGSRAIKLAQVQRIGDAWQITGRLLLPHAGEQPLDKQMLLDGTCAQTMASYSAALRLFKGRRAAMALPMAQVELRAFELPAGSRHELRNMVREELAAELGEMRSEFTFDFWELGEPVQPATRMIRVAALAVSHDISARTYSDLLGAGLECSVSDGVPCALARALDVSDLGAADEPVAALDVGHSTPIFVVSVAGRPLFSRLLRNCGLNSLVRPIQEGLKLSPEECRQLLARVGLPDGDDTTRNSAPATAVRQLAACFLETLTGEVQRTLAYLGQQYPQLLPRRMALFGGGAVIPNLAEHLAAKVDTPTTVWSFRPSDASNRDLSDSLYGVAVGLSILAWERTSCT